MTDKQEILQGICATCPLVSRRVPHLYCRKNALTLEYFTKLCDTSDITSRACPILCVSKGLRELGESAIIDIYQRWLKTVTRHDTAKGKASNSNTLDSKPQCSRVYNARYKLANVVTRFPRPGMNSNLTTTVQIDDGNDDTQTRIAADGERYTGRWEGLLKGMYQGCMESRTAQEFDSTWPAQFPTGDQCRPNNVINASIGRQLFVDPFLLEATNTIAFQSHSAGKPEVVFSPDQNLPWETAELGTDSPDNMIYWPRHVASAILDTGLVYEHNGTLSMLYMCGFGNLKGQGGMCLAASVNGVHWKRIYNGPTNVVFPMANVGALNVFRVGHDLKGFVCSYITWQVHNALRLLPKALCVEHQRQFKQTRVWANQYWTSHMLLSGRCH